MQRRTNQNQFLPDDQLDEKLMKVDRGELKAAEELINLYKNLKSKETKESIEDRLVIKINLNNSVFLHWLAYLGETEFYEALIEKGASYSKDFHGRKPIHYAVQQDKYEVLEYILSKNIETARDQDLRTDQLEIYEADDQTFTPISLSIQLNNLNTFNRIKAGKQTFLDTKDISIVTPYQIPVSKLSLNPISIKYYSLGNPKWADVVCSEPTYDWIANPTGQIVTVSEESDDEVDVQIMSRFCSGFNIGQGYFLTAGHCLGDVCNQIEQESSINYRVSFNYQYPICSIYSNLSPDGDIQENIYTIDIKEHGTCGNNIDFAVFKLNLDAQKLFGSVDITSDIPPNNHDIVLAHHPDGLPKKISIGKIQRNSSQEQKGEINYTAHTFGGSSGSPAGSISEKVVFGVHVKDDRAAQSVHLGLTIDEIANYSPIVKNLAKVGIFAQTPPLQTPPQQPNNSRNKNQPTPGRRYRLTNG